MKTIIPTATAVNRILRVSKYNRNGTLRLISSVTTEKVVLRQPAVFIGPGGVAEIDPENPDHWMDIISEGETFTLDVNNTSRGVPFNGMMLVAKEAGVGENAFGVEYYA